MNRTRKALPALFAITLTLLLGPPVSVYAATMVEHLQVEYRPQPLGIDVAQPRFSWRMAATKGERGVRQSAYQVQVMNPRGAVAWDSGKVSDSGAVAIQYAGSPLSPATRYTWKLTVWDGGDAPVSGASWFETGLMSPTPDSLAWAGAKWIGGGDKDLVLYAPYLAIFDLRYTMAIHPGSTHASFVYGANDSRLMDKNKNIYQLQNGRDKSYIKLELDLSGITDSADGTAKLKVYRAGYKDTDVAATPLRTFTIGKDIVNSGNKNAEHEVAISSAFGQITILIDGKASLTPEGGEAASEQGGGPPGRRPAPNSLNLNPVGAGGNFIPFGMLCDIGFSLDAGQSATFRDLTVSNTRAPKSTLFHEDLTQGAYHGIFATSRTAVSGLSIARGAYVVDGGSTGVMIARSPSHNSMPMLRTTFTTSGKVVEQARLYVTARGIYEAYLNGKRVGDDYYNPGLTQYNVTQMYQTYDVTGMIKPGSNTLGAMLGEGWWSGLLSFGNIWNHFGDRQSLLAKLVVTYKDGSSDVIVSDPERWKFFNDGPVLYSSLDFGEIYDSRKEGAVAGWSTAAYLDKRWKGAVEVPLRGTTFSGSASAGPGPGAGGPPAPPFSFDKVSLAGQIGNNAAVFKTLKAKSVREVRPGVFVYDIGQNIVGVPRIAIASGQAGKVVTLRYSEILYPNLPASGNNVGMPMTENYRAALSQDLYTMKAGAQVLQPKFTFRGFQYIEVTGIDKALPIEAVQGIAISSVREVTADYNTSNSKVNRLWSNLVWSNIDNFLTIPTDCPQRNERMGWSGDINVFSRTATYVSDADQFLTRHMVGMRDVQTPNGRFTDIAPVGGGFGGVLWGSAGVVVPWETYRQYKDIGLLQANYPAMVAYLDYLETTINPTTGLSSDAALGDWLGPQNVALGTDFVVTAYHAYDLNIMAKVAEILGKPAEAAKYKAMYEKRKSFFNATFVNAEKKTMGTTGGGRGFGGGAPAPLKFRVADTQTSYAAGLALDLFSDENKPYMVRNLQAAVSRENKDDTGATRPPYSLMTGFIGTSWIGNALSENGLSGSAYKVLQNEKYPSWLYAIDQGATTIWERLNGYTVEDGFGGNNSMNSFNHYSFGAIGQWMLAYSLGIRRDEAGFQHFILSPMPDSTGGMTFAEGYYDSMYGRIKSSWKVDGGVVHYIMTVPPNATATLNIPGASERAVKIVGDAAGATFVQFKDGLATYRLASGTYAFDGTN